MLALNWPWANPDSRNEAGMAARLASSLCAGIGGRVHQTTSHGIDVAYRPLRDNTRSRAWRPNEEAGCLTVFHGYFDNADDIAADLNVEWSDFSHLYALAVRAWGDEADLRIVGEYCAVMAHVAESRLRLSRSPLRAPPLCYFHDEEVAIAGSVPRIFFAAGVPRRLNEQRVVDAAMVNYSEQEAGWFEGIHRVPLGSAVHLERGSPRRLHQYYDPQTIQALEINDAEAIERTKLLLDEAVEKCLTGFDRPGTTLSGGLDSSQVAARVLDKIPASRTLPAFTFIPEAEYDGRVDVGMLGNEQKMVEEYLALHPRIEPHFTDNCGYEHDYRWNELFHLMSGAPAGLCNLYVFHGLFSEAVKQRCDLLLVCDWGNFAFSDKGYWAYVEYFMTGRWRQLWRALKAIDSPRPIWWLFGSKCLVPLLPNRLWSLFQRHVRGRKVALLDLMQPFTKTFRSNSGADRRVEQANFICERYQPRNARHARALLLQNDDGEAAEIYQAFEQLYGIAQRDPLAYRPLVEFCWSLPTRMFMRNGEMRWLAKQTAAGMMPEVQRANQLNGRWDADWHLRIGRRRHDYIAELRLIAENPRFTGMFDVDRLIAALENWPGQTETDQRKYAEIEFAVPRALLAARFIQYVEGRNTPAAAESD